MNDLEELEEFIGCYFHQDWTMKAETDEDAVKLYLSQFHESLVDQCLAEIDAVVQMAMEGSDNIDALLDGLGCYYAYQNFGYTGLEWLKRLKSLIQMHRDQIKFVPVNGPNAGELEPDGR